MSCNAPLGLENGLITDSQIFGMQSYNDDNLNYGANFARLNDKRGYRGKQGEGSNAWITINLQKPVVITEIKTQGYGDRSVSEWVTTFQLFYAKGTADDYKYFKDKNGAQMVSETDLVVFDLLKQADGVPRCVP